MRYDTSVFIKEKEISINSNAYFIADIAANHDGDLNRAKNLIWLAKEAGADAVKFQHFKAEKIVSDFGFNQLGSSLSHQKDWGKSVFDTYLQYECKRDWNEELALTAESAGIDFMTTPYDYEAIQELDRYIPAYKIGSGDITWIDFVEEVAQKGKPVILATGASEISDVERAVEAILKHNKQLVLLQCNTNYTASLENFGYVNLNVLKQYAIRFPQLILGLSDHTSGHATVLGAIAMNAKVIEKHFTDDNSRIGPDHKFSMNPITWKEMMDRSRELEAALGNGLKKIEENEKETMIVQRRCLRLTKELKEGHQISENDLESLRPAPPGSLEPYRKNGVIGKVLKVNKKKGDFLSLIDVEDLNA